MYYSPSCYFYTRGHFSRLFVREALYTEKITRIECIVNDSVYSFPRRTHRSLLTDALFSPVCLTGQVDGEEMLLFNLTALSPSEVITSVELHFYKRRSIGRKKYAGKPHHQHYLQGFAIDSEDSGARPVRLVGKWELGLDKRGWQVYDVTTAVDSAPGPAIGFRFQGVRRSNGQYESLPVEQVMRMEPSPFLVVFSNERSNATLDESLVSQRDSNALPDEDSNRKKRGIDDNELPEVDHYSSSNAIPQTSPGVLQARARPSSPGSRKISPGKSTLPYPKSSPAPSSTSSSSGAGSTLAWPDDKKRSRTGGSGSASSNNNRKGKRRNRKLPETWHYNQQVNATITRFPVKKTRDPALPAGPGAFYRAFGGPVSSPIFPAVSSRVFGGGGGQ